jgi:hypothetical protein
LNTSISQKDLNISELNNTISQKDLNISELNTSISQKDLNISELNTSISQKDLNISELNTSISQKDLNISELNASVQDLNVKLYKEQNHYSFSDGYSKLTVSDNKFNEIDVIIEFSENNNNQNIMSYSILNKGIYKTNFDDNKKTFDLTAILIESPELRYYLYTKIYIKLDGNTGLEYEHRRSAFNDYNVPKIIQSTISSSITGYGGKVRKLSLSKFGEHESFDVCKVTVINSDGQVTSIPVSENNNRVMYFELWSDGSPHFNVGTPTIYEIRKSSDKSLIIRVSYIC